MPASARDTDLRVGEHGYRDGANMMIAMPTRQTAAPTKSHALGRMASTIQSHKMATVM